MFSDIGEKIKKLAEVLCWIGIIASIILGIVIMSIGDESGLRALGFLIMIFGSLLSWVSSFFTYGFGELIVKATEIEKNTRAIHGDPISGLNPQNTGANNTEEDPRGAKAPVLGDWNSEIERLNDKELLERYHNEYEWSPEYRELCYGELLKRGAEEERDKWFCPECARENDINTKICKCGYKKD